MRDRGITLLLAIGAFALFYLLFVPKPQAELEKPTLPLTTEKGPNGYLGLSLWLKDAGVPVLSWRERFDRIARLEPRTGNLLITTLPFRVGLRSREAQTLREWVEDGNTLLVMAALADTPDWSMDGDHDPNPLPVLQELTDIEFESVGDSAKGQSDERPQEPAQESDREEPNQTASNEKESSRDATIDKVRRGLKKMLEPEDRMAVPAGNHPLLAGVRQIAARSEFPADDWRPVVTDGGLVLRLAQRDTADEGVLWMRSVGAGQIIVSGFASPLTNKLLNTADNAVLASNIVKWARSASGTVIIDDAHQGAVEFYDPEAFFADSRLHATLWWLVIAWFIFVMGASRLRIDNEAWNPIDITAFVRATGGFIARSVNPQRTARGVLRLFFNDLRRRLALAQNGEPLWEWLGQQERIAPDDLAALRNFHGRAMAGQRVDLVRLHNLIRKLMGSFA